MPIEEVLITYNITLDVKHAYSVVRLSFPTIPIELENHKYFSTF